MSDIYETVGEAIRLHRKKIGITQAKLAEIANLSTNFIGQIERGTKKASLDTVKKIADAMQIPVGKLFNEITEDKLSETKHKKVLDYQIQKAVRYILQDNKLVYTIGKAVLKTLSNRNKGD